MTPERLGIRPDLFEIKPNRLPESWEMEGQPEFNLKVFLG